MVLSDGSSKQQVMEKELDRELLSISFFSFLHQAAMPFADLVDGSYLSTLDSNSLGAVGVVRSSQNSVSKLYNSPLSKTTISLIASASGEEAREEEEQGQNYVQYLLVPDIYARPLSRSVSHLFQRNYPLPYRPL
jgi:Na+-driven multidrug efflux pump